MRSALRRLPPGPSIRTERAAQLAKAPRTCGCKLSESNIGSSVQVDGAGKSVATVPPRCDVVARSGHMIPPRGRVSSTPHIRSHLYVHLQPYRPRSHALCSPPVHRQALRNASHAAALQEQDEEEEPTSHAQFHHHQRVLHRDDSGTSVPYYNPNSTSIDNGHLDVTQTRHATPNANYEYWLGSRYHSPYPFHLDDQADRWRRSQASLGRQDSWSFGVPVLEIDRDLSQDGGGDLEVGNRVTDSPIDGVPGATIASARGGEAALEESDRVSQVVLDESPVQGFDSGGIPSPVQVLAGAHKGGILRGSVSAAVEVSATGGHQKSSFPLSKGDRLAAIERASCVASNTPRTATPSPTTSTRWDKIREELRLPLAEAKGIRMCLLSRFSRSGKPGLHLGSLFQIMEEYGEEQDWALLIQHIEQFRKELRRPSTVPAVGENAVYGTPAVRRTSQMAGLAIRARIGLARLSQELTTVEEAIALLTRQVAQHEIKPVFMPAISGFIALADHLGHATRADSVVIQHMDKLRFLDGEARPNAITLAQQDAHFREYFSRRLRAVAKPLEWFHRMIALRDKEDTQGAAYQEAAASTMVFALSADEALLPTAAVFCNEVRRGGHSISNTSASNLWRSLARSGDWEAAVRLFRHQASQPAKPSAPSGWRQQGIGLHIGARDLAGAVRVLENILADKQPLHPHVVLELLTEIKLAGKCQEAIDVARQAFPAQMQFLESGQASDSPADDRAKDLAGLLYSRMLSVYAEQGNMDGVNLVVKAVAGMQRQLTSVDYNVMLDLFARRNNVPAGLGVHKEMAAAGIEPDSFTINSLAGLCSKQDDPQAALTLYRKAEAHGLALSPLTVNTIMNAQVDAGEYSVATAIWKGLDSAQQSHPSIVTTLVKGMVHVSAPFNEVRRTVVEAFGSLADAPIRCWTLLIMSACDADRMKEAEDLYGDLAFHEQQRHPELKVNIFAASVLMATYLRRDALTSAVKIYHDLLARGHQLSAVTHAIIVKAISAAKWSVATQVDAVSFVEGVMGVKPDEDGDELDISYGELETLITPLIVAGGRNLEISKAKSWFKRALSQEGETIALRTALMDTHAKAGRTQDVRRDWRSILAIASGGAPAGPDPTAALDLLDRNSLKRLRIPLSIYVSAMSEAGLHEEVDRAWHDLIGAGLIPDARNWNHIMIAHLRAGRVEDAFRISENVLLPAHEEVMSRPVRSMRAGDVAEDAEVGSDSLSGSLASLTIASRGSTQRRRYRDLRDGELLRMQLRRQRHRDEGESADSPEANFARFKKFRTAMLILDQWRPSDLGKQPFGATLAALDHVYRDLELGRPVLKVVSSKRALALVASDDDGDLGEPEDIEQAQLEADIDNKRREASFGGETHGEPPDGSQGQGRARQSLGPLALLARIDKRYAKTVSLISLYRRKKQARARRE